MMRQQQLRRNPSRLLATILVSSTIPASLFGIAPQNPDAVNQSLAAMATSVDALHVEPSLRSVSTDKSLSSAEGASLDRFYATHGADWDVRWDDRNDRPHLLQGSGVPLLPGRGNSLTQTFAGRSTAVGPLQLSDVEKAIRSFLADNPDLLRVQDFDLRLDLSQSHSFGPHQEIWFVELQQFHQGVPVDDASVFFRINHGNAVQLGVHRAAEVTADTQPTIPARRAWRIIRRAIGENAQFGERVDRGTLKLFPTLGEGEVRGNKYAGPEGRGYSHRLAWELVFTLQGDERQYRARVDAHNGEVLELLDLTRYASVTGQIYPVTNTDPLVSVGFPSCSVTNAGTKVTDASGNYTYSGGTATSTLNGRYMRMSDNCGAISLSNSTTGNLDFSGSGGTDCVTPGVGGAGNTHSSRSGFYHLTNINRKAATFLPGNTWLDSTVTANMNINATCNAFWNGSTVNFYRSGGGCSNTGEIAAVFLHEWGHGMDTNSGGAASEAGSGEAVGDTFAFLETKDGCIGENFLPGSPCANCRSSCTGVRDVAAFALGGISTIASPANVASNSGINCDRFACPYTTPTGQIYRGPMGYEGHCESYIASTANWDLAQMLVTEHGTTAGWATMDSIWYGSLTPSKSAYRVAAGGTCNPAATVDGCASNNWYTVYLSVDDDDGNLANGTPNGCRIWDAFNAHGISCGSRPACSTTCSPTAVANAGSDVTICQGNSTTIGTAAQAGHTYSWSPGGATTAQITVSPSVTTTYTVTATTSCGSVQDSVTVTVDDGSGGGLTSDFEGGLAGWTTSGLWHRTVSSSCATPGYSSPTAAVYYGQDASCNYSTGAANTGTLISPTITGITSSSTLTFDYFRQVESFTGGSFDRAEVAVSVAGSGTWTTLWSRDSTNASENAWTASPTISLASFAGSNIQVRFLFNSVDSTANTFTGWFVDDVVVTATSSCVPTNTAPSVSISAPANGSSFVQGTSVSFSGSATDAEDGSLSASLAWSSSLDGAIGSGASFFTSTLSVGTHTITASVTDSGGLSGSAAISISITTPTNTPPSVSISAPTNGSSFPQGSSVSFSGSATDAEDGSLSASLSWSSSLDGAIGSGASFSISTLSVGSHTITASVTDSGGLSGSASVSVTITGTGGCTDCINWSTTPTVSYSTQDISKSFAVEGGGTTILLSANTWRRTSQTFNITATTVLEFEFMSTSEGEIHGIGFEENDNISDATRIFQLFGTQNWTSANHDFDTYATGNLNNFVSYSIPVGTYYTGSAMFLALVNDKDAGTLNNTSRFRNVRVFTPAPASCTTILHATTFESGANGWAHSAANSTCSTGNWLLGNPTAVVNGGVTTQLEDDHTAAPGVNAFFTAVNTSAGVNDVDGGTCTALSPTINASAYSQVQVSLWYFHGQRDAGTDAGDFFRIDVSKDGGSTWTTNLVSIGDVTNNAAWTEVKQTITNPGQLRIRLQAADGTSNGDLIEGGLDDVQVCVLQ